HQHGTNTFTATRPSGSTDSVTQSNLQLYKGSLTSRASGRPIIEFDVTRRNTAGSHWNSYYLHSSEGNAIVLIRNGGTLPRNLSIVTPHEVWVEESFNTPTNPAEIQRASIVTTKKVIGVAD